MPTIQKCGDKLTLIEIAKFYKKTTALNEWCIQNKMKFHPDECKVLTVSNNETPLFIEALPFTTTFYLIGQDIIDYTDSQKDLGIYINTKLDWTEH